ncbi:MAG: NAD-dependent epimerase/dehydratase family protein [Candidatus Nanopelagicales bacterium]|nr:NAD-dependent epimerase/dehydratase family protein [Candidatus Nanopelagicales bacterium]
MRYFVTGATGFIGGAVVRLLRERGDEVVAVVRDPGRARHLADGGAEVVRGDVADRASLVEPMRGVDGVFHIAGWYRIGVDDPDAAWATNVDGTRNVLDVMGELGIPKGVYTSTLAVNSDTHGVEVDEDYHFAGRHLSLYDLTKAEAHRIALARSRAGLPLVTVLPGVVYGPDDPSAVGKALRDLLRGRLPVITTGTAYSWAHVEDVADAHLRAMDRGRPGEAYNISGESRTLVEAVRMAGEVAERRTPLVVPARAVRAMAPLAAGLGRVLPLPDELTGESLRVSSGPTYLGSNAKARRELGFAPRPFEVGWPPVVLHELAGLG